jgi:urease accessory protein
MNSHADGATVPVTATQLARLLQFGDSMLPIGGFSFSGGLESAIQKGVVTDVASLGEFTRTAVEQAARGDGIAIVCAHRAALVGEIEELLRIDARVYARKLSSETRSMSTKMGRKFTELGAHVTSAATMRDWRERVLSGATPGCYPVALAIHFAAQGLSARDAFVVHQYGVAATILGAALRLMRISHIDTQSLLFQLNADMDSPYATAASATLDDMAGFAPLADILAAVHVKAHVRLFMN